MPIFELHSDDGELLDTIETDSVVDRVQLIGQGYRISESTPPAAPTDPVSTDPAPAPTDPVSADPAPATTESAPDAPAEPASAGPASKRSRR